MLFPKKTKHRKWQKARRNPKKAVVATRGTTLSYGSFGLKTTTANRINSNQIEAARRVIRRTSGKTSKIWLRVFPDRPYTKKPIGVKMGKGKGDPQGFEVEVKPGRIIFEIDGVSEDLARLSLEKGGKKLPLKTKVISR